MVFTRFKVYCLFFIIFFVEKHYGAIFKILINKKYRMQS